MSGRVVQRWIARLGTPARNELAAAASESGGRVVQRWIARLGTPARNELAAAASRSVDVR